MIPHEELERILAAPDFGPQRYPEVVRLLRDAPLVFLVPYHPGVRGDFTVQEGDPMPQFIIWKTKAGERQVPIFTSVRCATEACQKTKRRERKYALGEAEGKQLFHLLGDQPDPVVINPACSIQSLYLDRNAVQKLADGSILAPDTGTRKESNAEIVKPADYPTDFLQPLIQFLCERPEVKAGWLLRNVETQDTGTHYIFVLKIAGPDTGLLQDFRIISDTIRPKGVEAAVALLDPNNTQLVKVTSAHTPFYAALDYPAGTAEER